MVKVSGVYGLCSLEKIVVAKSKAFVTLCKDSPLVNLVVCK